MVAVTAACSDELAVTEPLATPLPQAVKFWEDNAAVDWNTVARSHVAANNSNALVAIRGYAIVSLAQYQAAVAAEQAAGNGPSPSVRAAIGAASVVALSYLYPAAGDTLEDRLDRVLALPGWPGQDQADMAAGEAIGRAAAAAVVARAQTDRFFAPFTGTVPVCDGCWFSATPPAGAMVGQAKTYFLESGSQFRPAPPPAFNSPAFLAALGEVRQISNTRTAEQTAIAQFWNLPAGTYQPPGYWNEEATILAVKYHLGERETAHLLALMNMVSHDIIVASHEAKYYYWLLRPTMADPNITLPIGLPNFPSYPSNHAAISAGMVRILGDVFPAERARLDVLAEEAMLSRVYGGIHYRFDGDAGLELGRRIAAYAAERDVNGKDPFIID
jgi:membrane-associated phospholipid phosphatase